MNHVEDIMTSRITRRDFVQTSAGLVITFYLPTRHAAARVDAAEGEFAPNAWLRVGTDGIVTLTVDKAEMGQGSQTGLAMILAEELDADWATVRLGPVPENPAGWSRRMSTGGSTAIRTSWEPLRKAGAVARGMLIASIERGPVFGGMLKRYDAAKAEALPGVRAVVALEPSAWTGTGGAWAAGCAAGVAVVADNYWNAVQGRRALEIEWDEGEAAALGSDGIRAEFARLAEQAGVEARKDGDAAGTLAGAAKRVEAVYEAPFLHHATMEPMNCTAHVRADGCDVWA